MIVNMQPNKSRGRVKRADVEIGSDAKYVMANYDEMSRRIEWSKNEFSHRLTPEPTSIGAFCSAFAVDIAGPARLSSGRYLARTIFSRGRPMLCLLLSCLVSCVGPSTRVQTNDQHQSRPPTGTFIKYAAYSSNWEAQPIALMNARLNTQLIALFSVRLDDDGTYLAEDYSPPEFTFIVGGKMMFPSRANPAVEKGRWSWDKQPRKLLLVPTYGFRFDIRHLRFDSSNPDRLEWGGSFMQWSSNFLERRRV